MKRMRLALGFALVLVISLVAAPGASASPPPQSGGGDDDTAQSVPQVDGNVGKLHIAADPVDREVVAARVQAYWTSARMAAARPVPGRAIGESDLKTGSLVQANGPAGYVSGINVGAVETGPTAGTLLGGSTQTPNFTYPFAFTRSGMTIPIMTAVFGKLYLSNDYYGGDFYCGASVITSGNTNYDLVITEGACLHAGNGNDSGWSYDMLFCPGTAYGSNPYGCWTDEYAYVPPAWYTSANARYDYGFVDTLDSSNPGGCNNDVADCVGANGIAWNQPAFQFFWSPGYPYLNFSPPGQVLYVCTGSLGRLGTSGSTGPLTLGMGCDLQDSYGGPWIISAKVANKGIVNSVFSYKLNQRDFYGPYFDSSFFSLWDAAT